MEERKPATRRNFRYGALSNGHCEDGRVKLTLATLGRWQSTYVTHLHNGE